MRKIFTLLTVLCALNATAWAQDDELDTSVIFVDRDGNEVPDGTVLTITTLNSEGQMVVPLVTKNVSGEKVAVSMYEVIDDKPNGGWQTCAFGNCMALNASGYSAKSIVAADYSGDIQTEWEPEAGAYASWTATLQVHLFNVVKKEQWGQIVEQPGNNIIGYGPKVTVNFIYADPAAINAPSTQVSGQAEAYYSLSGSRRSTPQHGISIVRLANGKMIKKIVR